MSNNKPYSLSNPPPGPRKNKKIREPNPVMLDRITQINLKSTEETEEQPEWLFLENSGRVRSKFLSYNPEDVEKIGDINFLQTLRGWYLPSSQPRNWYEEAYCRMMREACSSRIYSLGRSSTPM